MIDRVVQNMIDDINGKARKEREKLKQIIKEAQTGLKDITLLDQRRTEHDKTRQNAVQHQKLKSLESEISRFQLVTVPELPTIRYTPKEISLTCLEHTGETRRVQKSSELRYKSEERTASVSIRLNIVLVEVIS
ncbi:Hypothetical predicted protein [Mytilus galloprovincialis]|uniref:Uncharacterized protein n=1 Tax=Mytilus galloprovincialis TaxID=29158 RepID=A0A8B6EB08_MYTGA|nr:Hypothetical predicted protein [Mytilus galloprovincialis]